MQRLSSRWWRLRSRSSSDVEKTSRRAGWLSEGGFSHYTWLAGRTERWANGYWRGKGLDDSSGHRHSVRISWPCGRGVANSLAGGYDGSGQSVKRALGETKRQGRVTGLIPSPVDFSTKSLAFPELFPPVYTFYFYYFYVLF